MKKSLPVEWLRRRRSLWSEGRVSLRPRGPTDWLVRVSVCVCVRMRAVRGGSIRREDCCDCRPPPLPLPVRHDMRLAAPRARRRPSGGGSPVAADGTPPTAPADPSAGTPANHEPPDAQPGRLLLLRGHVLSSKTRHLKNQWNVWKSQLRFLLVNLLHIDNYIVTWYHLEGYNYIVVQYRKHSRVNHLFVRAEKSFKDSLFCERKVLTDLVHHSSTKCYLYLITRESILECEAA